MTRVAVVQPALSLGEVDANLGRVEDLIRDAHREHSPDVVVLPEAFTTPNVYARVLRETPLPVDGRPFRMLTQLAQELDCVLAGGFVAIRGAHTYGTFVLAEPDGAAHLHDKDIPTAWEQHFYRGGDDRGVVRCGALDCNVGLMSGWEWARFGTARARARGQRRVVLGGMCWPSMPLNWPGPLRWWAQREHGIWREQARALPGQVARLTGVPVAHASHVGPIAGRNTARSGHPLGDEDARGVADLRARRHDPREAHARGWRGSRRRGRRSRPAPTPVDPIQERYWIPDFTVTTHAAWHAMNAHGALGYRLRHARRRFPWQALPGGDLPDEILPSTAGDGGFATGS